MNADTPLTLLLRRWSEGDLQAREAVISRLYGELRRMAHRQMRREDAAHTLQPTAVVNEVCLRLLGQQRAEWHNRDQFLGVVAQLMRRVLVDYARARDTAKRGGGHEPLRLDEIDEIPMDQPAELIALDEALVDLATISPERARIVELRFFGGLDVQETARVMDVSPATVGRWWRSARAWLHHELRQRLER